MFKRKKNYHQEPDTKPCKKCAHYKTDYSDCEYCDFTNSFRPFERKKKKTGCETPEYRCPTMPPVAPAPRIKYATSENFDNINNLVIKSIESISIVVEKDRQTASMEFTGLQDATCPTMEITSWDNEYVNYLGNVVFANRLTVRDAFAPGGTVRLKGTFKDVTTHELYDGEMDMLTWKFTKKETNICKE